MMELNEEQEGVRDSPLEQFCASSVRDSSGQTLSFHACTLTAWLQGRTCQRAAEVGTSGSVEVARSTAAGKHRAVVH